MMLEETWVVTRQAKKEGFQRLYATWLSPSFHSLRSESLPKSFVHGIYSNLSPKAASQNFACRLHMECTALTSYQSVFACFCTLFSTIRSTAHSGNGWRNAGFLNIGMFCPPINSEISHEVNFFATERNPLKPWSFHPLALRSFPPLYSFWNIFWDPQSSVSLSQPSRRQLENHSPAWTDISGTQNNAFKW